MERNDDSFAEYYRDQELNEGAYEVADRFRDEGPSMGEYEESCLDPDEPEMAAEEIVRLQREMVWTTRDKRKVKVKDMTDSHLVNTVRWLRRNEPALLTLVLVRDCPPEDGPSEHDIVMIMEVAQGMKRGAFINDLPICVAMMEEARRRGLTMCLWTP